MDYHGMKRRELQTLCKKHDLPANGTNLQMADSLKELLKIAEKGRTARLSCLVSVRTAGEGAAKKVRFSLEEEKLEAIEEILDEEPKRKGSDIWEGSVTGAEKTGPCRKSKGSDEKIEGIQDVSGRTTRSRVQMTTETGPDIRSAFVSRRKKQKNSESSKEFEVKNVQEEEPSPVEEVAGKRAEEEEMAAEVSAVRKIAARPISRKKGKKSGNCEENKLKNVQEDKPFTCDVKAEQEKGEEEISGDEKPVTRSLRSRQVLILDDEKPTVKKILSEQQIVTGNGVSKNFLPQKVTDVKEMPADDQIPRKTRRVVRGNEKKDETNEVGKDFPELNAGISVQNKETRSHVRRSLRNHSGKSGPSEETLTGDEVTCVNRTETGTGHQQDKGKDTVIEEAPRRTRRNVLRNGVSVPNCEETENNEIVGLNKYGKRTRGRVSEKEPLVQVTGTRAETGMVLHQEKEEVDKTEVPRRTRQNASRKGVSIHENEQRDTKTGEVVGENRSKKPSRSRVSENESRIGNAVEHREEKAKVCNIEGAQRRTRRLTSRTGVLDLESEERERENGEPAGKNKSRKRSRGHVSETDASVKENEGRVEIVHESVMVHQTVCEIKEAPRRTRRNAWMKRAFVPENEDRETENGGTVPKNKSQRRSIGHVLEKASVQENRTRTRIDSRRDLKISERQVLDEEEAKLATQNDGTLETEKNNSNKKKRKDHVYKRKGKKHRIPIDPKELKEVQEFVDSEIAGPLLEHTVSKILDPVDILPVLIENRNAPMELNNTELLEQSDSGNEVEDRSVALEISESREKVNTVFKEIVEETKSLLSSHSCLSHKSTREFEFRTQFRMDHEEFLIVAEDREISDTILDDKEAAGVDEVVDIVPEENKPDDPEVLEVEAVATTVSRVVVEERNVDETAPERLEFTAPEVAEAKEAAVTVSDIVALKNNRGTASVEIENEPDDPEVLEVEAVAATVFGVGVERKIDETAPEGLEFAAPEVVESKEAAATVSEIVALEDIEGTLLEEIEFEHLEVAEAKPIAETTVFEFVEVRKIDGTVSGGFQSEVPEIVREAVSEEQQCGGEAKEVAGNVSEGVAATNYTDKTFSWFEHEDPKIEMGEAVSEEIRHGDLDIAEAATPLEVVAKEKTINGAVSKGLKCVDQELDVEDKEDIGSQVPEEVGKITVPVEEILECIGAVQIAEPREVGTVMGIDYQNDKEDANIHVVHEMVADHSTQFAAEGEPVFNLFDVVADHLLCKQNTSRYEHEENKNSHTGENNSRLEEEPLQTAQLLLPMDQNDAGVHAEAKPPQSEEDIGDVGTPLQENHVLLDGHGTSSTTDLQTVDTKTTVLVPSHLCLRPKALLDLEFTTVPELDCKDNDSRGMNGTIPGHKHVYPKVEVAGSVPGEVECVAGVEVATTVSMLEREKRKTTETVAGLGCDPEFIDAEEIAATVSMLVAEETVAETVGGLECVDAGVEVEEAVLEEVKPKEPEFLQGQEVFEGVSKGLSEEIENSRAMFRIKSDIPISEVAETISEETEHGDLEAKGKAIDATVLEVVAEERETNGIVLQGLEYENSNIEDEMGEIGSVFVADEKGTETNGGLEYVDGGVEVEEAILVEVKRKEPEILQGKEVFESVSKTQPEVIENSKTVFRLESDVPISEAEETISEETEHGDLEAKGKEINATISEVVAEERATNGNVLQGLEFEDSNIEDEAGEIGSVLVAEENTTETVGVLGCVDGGVEVEEAISEEVKPNEPEILQVKEVFESLAKTIPEEIEYSKTAFRLESEEPLSEVYVTISNETECGDLEAKAKEIAATVLEVVAEDRETDGSVSQRLEYEDSYIADEVGEIVSVPKFNCAEEVAEVRDDEETVEICTLEDASKISQSVPESNCAEEVAVESNTRIIIGSECEEDGVPGVQVVNSYIEDEETEEEISSQEEARIVTKSVPEPECAEEVVRARDDGLNIQCKWGKDGGTGIQVGNSNTEEETYGFGSAEHAREITEFVQESKCGGEVAEARNAEIILTKEYVEDEGESGFQVDTSTVVDKEVAELSSPEMRETYESVSEPKSALVAYAGKITQNGYEECEGGAGIHMVDKIDADHRNATIASFSPATMLDDQSKSVFNLLDYRVNVADEGEAGFPVDNSTIVDNKSVSEPKSAGVAYAGAVIRNRYQEDEVEAGIQMVDKIVADYRIAPIGSFSPTAMPDDQSKPIFDLLDYQAYVADEEEAGFQVDTSAIVDKEVAEICSPKVRGTNEYVSEPKSAAEVAYDGTIIQNRCEEDEREAGIQVVDKVGSDYIIAPIAILSPAAMPDDQSKHVFNLLDYRVDNDFCLWQQRAIRDEHEEEFARLKQEKDEISIHNAVSDVELPEKLYATGHIVETGSVYSAACEEFAEAIEITSTVFRDHSAEIAETVLEKEIEFNRIISAKLECDDLDTVVEETDVIDVEVTEEVNQITEPVVEAHETLRAHIDSNIELLEKLQRLFQRKLDSEKVTETISNEASATCLETRETEREISLKVATEEVSENITEETCTNGTSLGIGFEQVREEVQIKAVDEIVSEELESKEPEVLGGKEDSAAGMEDLDKETEICEEETEETDGIGYGGAEEEVQIQKVDVDADHNTCNTELSHSDMQNHQGNKPETDLFPSVEVVDSNCGPIVEDDILMALRELFAESDEFQILPAGDARFEDQIDQICSLLKTAGISLPVPGNSSDRTATSSSSSKKESNRIIKNLKTPLKSIQCLKLRLAVEEMKENSPCFVSKSSILKPENLPLKRKALEKLPSNNGKNDEEKSRFFIQG